MGEGWDTWTTKETIMKVRFHAFGIPSADEVTIEMPACPAVGQLVRFVGPSTRHCYVSPVVTVLIDIDEDGGCKIHCQLAAIKHNQGQGPKGDT